MKQTRRLLSILLALAMVCALATTAFATGGEGTGTLPDESSTSDATTYTITAPENGHTYEVYQIFTGDLSDNVLSNVKWGKNGNGTQGEAVSDAILTELEGTSGSDTAKLAVITKYVNFDSEEYGTVTGGTPLENVPAGYYLIKDVDGALEGEEDSYTLYIVQIVKDVTISPKADVPSFEKKLKDKNDTTGETSSWQDSADWDIGDKVPFQLKGTVASNYDSYKTYYFAFHDKEEAGLTFDSNSVKVYVDGNLITSGYEVKTTGITDGCTFEVIFQDLKKIESVNAGSEITVEYESTLNSSAKLGDQGNVNQAKLEFSNNPNQEQEGTPETGETPWDNVIVFTYKVIINKIDGKDKTALTGAAFKLEKEIFNADGENTWQTIKEFTVDEEKPISSFEFAGLDDGNYKLTETVTPAGYNTIDPITFTVNADHTITWDGTNRTVVLNSLSGNKVTGEISFTADKSAGSLSADVENNAGSTLPETGGIGTTIFYTVGGILVLVAVVLLVTKKRMNGAEA